MSKTPDTRSPTETHLSRSEFPVCCEAVSCIHEDFGDAQSFLDGLQLEPQQVEVDAVSFEYLNRGDKKTISERSAHGQQVEVDVTFTFRVRSE